MLLWCSLSCIVLLGEREGPQGYQEMGGVIEASEGYTELLRCSVGRVWLTETETDAKGHHLIYPTVGNSLCACWVMVFSLSQSHTHLVTSGLSRESWGLHKRTLVGGQVVCGRGPSACTYNDQKHRILGVWVSKFTLGERVVPLFLMLSTNHWLVKLALRQNTSF